MEKLKQFGHRFTALVTPDEGPSESAYLARHILTEAVPASPSPLTVTDLENLERTADPQCQSALLRLPIEVRVRIYDEVLEEAGRTQHVYVKDGRYTHTACVTDHDAPDERQVEVERRYITRTRGSLTTPSGRAVCCRRGQITGSARSSAVAATADGPPTPTPFFLYSLAASGCKFQVREPAPPNTVPLSAYLHLILGI